MSFLCAIGVKPKATVNHNPAIAASRRLVQRLEQEAFADAEALLSSATDENRERLIYGFACNSKSVPLAARWAGACPTSSMAHTVLGASLVVTGWKIRGDSYAEDVDPAAWKPFLDQLEDAKTPLHIAARLDNKSAEPFSWLIHAELAGDASRDNLANLFSEAIARSPLHWPSHYKYFNATTEKWGGSHREMFRFADETSKKAPRGSILHSLVAAAYNEYLLDGGDKSKRQIRTKEHAERVTAALYSWLDANPSTISDRLVRVGGGFSGYGLNHFAVACFHCGANKEAHEVMIALNDEIEPIPWCWIARGIRERMNAAFVYDRVKREVQMLSTHLNG